MNLDKLKSEFDFFYGYPNYDSDFCFECEDGWYELLHQLCLDIQAANPPENFCVVQVKEKFGTLRFYVDNSNKEIDDLIHEAEMKSSSICEYCGSTEKIETRADKGKYWIRTLCSECREE